MNRTHLFGLVVALLFGALSSSASAQQPMPIAAHRPGTVTQPTEHVATEIRQREQWQAIENAIARGTIDRQEAAQLTRRMEAIQRYQERAYTDGVLTLREQAHLVRYQTRLDRDLARASSR